jgi:hypothetical protein
MSCTKGYQDGRGTEKKAGTFKEGDTDLLKEWLEAVNRLFRPSQLLALNFSSNLLTRTNSLEDAASCKSRKSKTHQVITDD